MNSKHLSLWLLLVVFSNYNSRSQGVANGAVEMVDLFTGDLRYNLPLVNVPGPNGEDYPVTINYSSGVKVDQPASWVGLGWDFNPGEIRRSVRGIPDDFKGNVTYTTYWDKESNTYIQRVSSGYGPIYFRDFPISNYENSNGTGTNYDMDIENMRADDGGIYRIPAYDQYSVDVPGLGGEIVPHLFDYATLLAPKYSNQTGDNRVKNFTSGDEFKAFEKKPQFRFKSLNSVGVSLPEFKLYDDNTYVVNNLTGYCVGGGINCGTYSDPLGPLNPKQFSFNPIKKPGGVNTNFTGNINSTSNRLKESNFIVYFTNAQLANPNLSETENPNSCHFLEYGQSVNRANQPQDAIGAFQITDGNGFVYHFSLPVYASNDINSTYELNSSWDLLNGNKTPSYKYVNQNSLYAISWKLTAITGPDFKDLNSNNVADEEDSGFWIAFNYGKWSDAFFNRYPMYGLNTNLSADNRKFDGSGQYSFDFNMKGGLSQLITESYYLNSIKTATHSLVFVKDYRLDQKSNYNLANPAQAIIPSLYLRKVMLFNNTDNPLSKFGQGYSMGTYHPENVILWQNYVTNQALINSISLKSVELEYDYSLCRRYLNNSNVALGIPGDYSYSYPNSTVVGNYSQSGKLTLRKVKTYFLKHFDALPPYNFDYDGPNPDFSILPQFRDSWGFYNSDGSGYSTPVTRFLNSSNSFENACAWNLTSILSPLGAKTSFTYESDTYEVVYSNQLNNGQPVHKPIRYETDGGIDEIPYSTVPLGAVGSTFHYNFYDTHGNWVGEDFPRCQHMGANNFSYISLESAVGGGVRIKGITVSNPQNLQTDDYQIELSYNGGATSYEPDKLTVINEYADPHINCDLTPFGYTSSSLPDKVPIPYIVASTNVNRSYLPPCNVGYELVSVTELKNSVSNNVNGVVGKTIHHFQNVPPYEFKTPYNQSGYITDYVYSLSGGVNWTAGEGVKYDPSSWVEHLHKVVQLSDGFNLIGKPLRVETYDPNGLLINTRKIEYARKTIVQEAFHSKFAVFVSNTSSQLSSVSEVWLPSPYNPNLRMPVKIWTFSTSLSNIPNDVFYDPLTNIEADRGATTTFHLAFSRSYDNYLPVRVVELKDGLTTEIDFSNYDDLRGVFRTATNISKGNRTVKTKTYANISAMGPKVAGVSNTNQIFAESFSYSIPGGRTNVNWSNNTVKRMYDAGQNTFLNTSVSDIWKPVGKTWYEAYDLSNGQNRNLGTVTLFNKYFNVLESYSDADNYSAQKFGYNDLFQIATLSKGRYGEFTHCSVEDEYGGSYLGGEVLKGNGTRVKAFNANLTAHTGNFILSIPPESHGFRYDVLCPSSPTGGSVELQRNKFYEVSVWVHNANIQNQSLAVPTIQVLAGANPIATSSGYYEHSGQWSQLRLQFKVNPSDDESISIRVNNNSSGTIYADDFRLGPASASVGAYVYDSFSGLVTHELDANNFYTRYVYDGAGRVTGVYKETNKGEIKVSKTDYGFKRPLN